MKTLLLRILINLEKVPVRDYAQGLNVFRVVLSLGIESGLGFVIDDERPDVRRFRFFVRTVDGRLTWMLLFAIVAELPLIADIPDPWDLETLTTHHGHCRAEIHRISRREHGRDKRDWCDRGDG